MGSSPAVSEGEAVPAARSVATLHTPQKLARELEDLQLVMRARNGDGKALDELIRRYQGFVRLKASSYFLADMDEPAHREARPSRLGERVDEETRKRLEKLRRGQGTG